MKNFSKPRTQVAKGVFFGALAAGSLFAVYKRSEVRSRLSGKTVLITGGSRGLGLLMAREFLKRGARVSICARNEEELKQARKVLIPFSNDSQGVQIFRCDVSRREEVREFVRFTAHTLGGIDVIVNNASIIQMGPFDTFNEADWKSAMDINFWGTCYTTWEALPFLREKVKEARSPKHAMIVNITSIGGAFPAPHLLPYVAAKFAASGWSEGMRAELGAEGIRILTVVPGLMRTGSHFNALFKGQRKKEMDLFTLGATLPILSMSADRAAARIVRACARGEGYLTLGIPAKLARSIYQLFPNLTVNLEKQVSRFLPGPLGVHGEPGMPGEPGLDEERDQQAQSGWEVTRSSGMGVSGSWVSTLGRRAAERNNEKFAA